jgi:hypothetical protein
MKFLNLFDNQLPRSGGGDDAASGSGDRLQGRRDEADSLLAAGDEAIQRALGNGDSEAFLRAGRQQGGE